eukprot:536628-Alexandrium_andersonii.AAC.1
MFGEWCGIEVKCQWERCLASGRCHQGVFAVGLCPVPRCQCVVESCVDVWVFDNLGVQRLVGGLGEEAVDRARQLPVDAPGLNARSSIGPVMPDRDAQYERMQASLAERTLER